VIVYGLLPVNTDDRRTDEDLFDQVNKLDLFGNIEFLGTVWQDTILLSKVNV
jgi:hypothetical protein